MSLPRTVLTLALALLALALLVIPAEARRHHGWSYGYGWRHHSHHRGSRARLAREAVSNKPVAEPAPAAVYGPPMPTPLYIVRTIVNGVPAKAWIGPPPDWAGSLHVSPILSGRSASR